MQFFNPKIFYRDTGDKNQFNFLFTRKIERGNKMSINNVSFGKDYATEFGKKWDKELDNMKKQLPSNNVTVPIGQPTQKSENLTGLQIEKEDVTGNYAERKLIYSDDVEEARAQEAFVKYGTENGQKVKEEDAEKMAKNYVENERHKENVQKTQVFMDKKAYKQAEKERKEEYKEMYNQYREDGYTRKEAKRLAKAQSVENEYISGRKTRKFVENNREYFYDENGNFSSDKFKQKAVEYANINTHEEETLNYHMSLRERRAAAEKEGVSTNVIKHMAKKSNLDYEKDNTNLYRGLAIGGGAAAGYGIGSLFSVTSSAAAAAGSSSTAGAIINGSASASASAGAAASAAASASVNGGLVGAGSGLAAGVGASGFLQDKGKNEARVYAPGEKPVERHRPQTPDIDLIPAPPVNDVPNEPAKVEKPCPEEIWTTPACDYKVGKGDCWAGVIAGTMKVNGKAPQGNVLKALVHAEKLKHGITNFKLNTMPGVYSKKKYEELQAKNPEAAKKYFDTHTMKLYTDFTDLLENAELMKKHPELKYLKGLKEGDITVDCKARGLKFTGKPKVNYTKYKGTPVASNTYKQDCDDPVPVRINNK